MSGRWRTGAFPKFKQIFGNRVACNVCLGMVDFANDGLFCHTCGWVCHKNYLRGTYVDFGEDYVRCCLNCYEGDL